MNKFAMIAALIGMSAMAASAAVTLNPTIGPLELEGKDLPAGSLVAWIADMDGDGFDGLDQVGPEGFVVDDDVLLGLGNSGVTPGWVFQGQPLNVSVEDNGYLGKPLGLLFFDTEAPADLSEALSGLEGGIAYGAVVGFGEVPADGAAVNIQVTSPDYQTFVTIPEPATMAVLGLGGLLIARRRRNA
jgi:hypothetical protein